MPTSSGLSSGPGGWQSQAQLQEVGTASAAGQGFIRQLDQHTARQAEVDEARRCISTMDSLNIFVPSHWATRAYRPVKLTSWVVLTRACSAVSATHRSERSCWSWLRIDSRLDVTLTYAAQDVRSGCEHARDGPVDQLRGLRLRCAFTGAARWPQVRQCRGGDYGPLLAVEGPHAGPVRDAQQARVCLMSPPAVRQQPRLHEGA